MPSLQSQLFRRYLLRMRDNGSYLRPVPERRATFALQARAVIKPPGTRISQLSAGGVAAEWVDRPGPAPQTTLLYLHGGGYTIGSSATHRGLAGYLGRAVGARVLLLDYRLAPEHRFPAALDDTLAAYRWLRAQGRRQVIIAGDSAGGGLAVAAAVALRDAGDQLPDALISFSPWTDLAGSGASMVTRAAADPFLVPEAIVNAADYFGDTSPRHPLISPIYADLRGLPPLLIQVGGDEILLDDAVRLAARARLAGVAVTLDVWPAMWHVWQFFAPLLPEANQALAQAGAFARRALAGTLIAHAPTAPQESIRP